MPPYPLSTVFSLRHMSKRWPDNVLTTNGQNSGSWIVESHASATAPPTTMLLPTHPMTATIPSLQEPSPLKNQLRNTSPSPDALPAQPYSSQSNIHSLPSTPNAIVRTSPHISKKPGELSAIIRNYNCRERCNWIPDWQSTKLITMVR